MTALRDSLARVVELSGKVDAGWEAHGAELKKDFVDHEAVFPLWAETSEQEAMLAELAVNLIREHGEALVGMVRRDAAVAELIAAAHRLEVSANTVDYCCRNRPGNFAVALQGMKDDATNLRTALANIGGGK